MIEIMNRHSNDLEEILKEYLHMFDSALDSDIRYTLASKVLTAIGTAQKSHPLSESDLEDGSFNESKSESWVASELFGECLSKFSKLPGQPLVVEATLDRSRLSAAFLSAALKLGSYVRQLFCLLDSASGIDVAELGSQRMYIALVHSLTVEYMEACPLVLNVDGASYGTVLLRDYDPLTLDLRFDSDALADATDFSAQQVVNALRHLSMMQNVVAPAAQSLQQLTSKLTVSVSSCAGISLASIAAPPTLFDHHTSAGFMELEWYRVRSFSDGLKSVHLPAETEQVQFYQIQAVRLANLVTATTMKLFEPGLIVLCDHYQYDGIAAEDVGCTVLQCTFWVDGRSTVVIAKAHNECSIVSHELEILEQLQLCDNVVRLFSNVDDYTVDRFSYAMVLEQLDVGHHLDRQLQTVDTATECASQLLAGLIFFAKQGLIHMDIKPKSVGWSHVRKQWSFFNFNSARYGRAKDGRFWSNIVVGTVGYTAPEVEYPENFDYWHDCRADVYSLGVTLREMYGKAISTTDQHHPVVQAVNWMIEENRDARHTASHIYGYLTKCASASSRNSNSEAVDECESIHT
ncbi:kinase-like protein [Ramicandelaber brevisporus]|nr:kinase-like protein [Ramicandelaber brevisporus]